MFPRDPLDLTFQTLLEYAQEAALLLIGKVMIESVSAVLFCSSGDSRFSVMMKEGAESLWFRLEHEHEMLKLITPLSGY